MLLHVSIVKVTSVTKSLYCRSCILTQAHARLHTQCHLTKLQEPTSIKRVKKERKKWNAHISDIVHKEPMSFWRVHFRCLSQSLPWHGGAPNNFATLFCTRPGGAGLLVSVFFFSIFHSLLLVAPAFVLRARSLVVPCPALPCLCLPIFLFGCELWGEERRACDRGDLSQSFRLPPPSVPLSWDPFPLLLLPSG